MGKHQSVSIRQISRNRAEQVYGVAIAYFPLRKFAPERSLYYG
ncbi:hypothetical protein [Nostoc mirabile]|nr:hypothetical protein [Nostoc mirabile]